MNAIYIKHEIINSTVHGSNYYSLLPGMYQGGNRTILQRNVKEMENHPIQLHPVTNRILWLILFVVFLVVCFT